MLTLFELFGAVFLFMWFCNGQSRINNSSKCSNCYGPRAFGDPAVRCVKFFLLYVGWILEFGFPRQTLRKGPTFYTRYTKALFTESKFNFFNFV